MEAEDNEFALNTKNEVVYILDPLVQSGRKGYYCRGCERQMVAKKGEKIKKHFAHDPQDVENKHKCTYSDESYRHYLAKQYLAEIKEIKVPNLYKYPPSGIGKPMKIRDARFIQAFHVKMETTFYEDNEGNIKYGKKEDYKERVDYNLLIKPDVAFFDENFKPILLIEIVATHKIDGEKLSKIRRLGIDTIQITVPKGAPEEIKKIFYNTERTEWIYNYEQEKTTYLPFPSSDSEGILLTDSFQGRLLKTAESYECRKAQLGNIIRGLTKCLASEQFTESIQSIRTEIFRVEGNTTREREKLRDIEDEFRKGLQEQYQSKATELEESEIRLAGEEEEFRIKHSDLEERYIRKDSGIRWEKDLLWRTIGTNNTKLGELSKDEIRIRNEFEKTQRAERTQLELIDTIERRRDELSGQFKQSEERIRKEFSKDEREWSERNDRSIEDIERRREELPNNYRQLEDDIRSKFESDEKGIRDEFDELRTESTEAIANRDFNGSSRLFARIKKLVDARRDIEYIEKEISTYRRLQTARKLFENGSYKDWV